MKILKYISTFCLLAFIAFSCNEDDNLDFVDDISAPTNVSAEVSVTQDNTGLVTIIPLGDGVTKYDLNYGDGSDAESDLTPGSVLEHTYEEGTYELNIVAYALNGLTTEVTQPLEVSFQAPQNLMVTIENDPAISKQVNVTATADFALSYEVDFGTGADPVAGNIDEGVSFNYENAGTYTITVTAFSAAIETTEYAEEFLVTEILQPITGAPAQPARAETDVISVYSNTYTNIANTDFFPNWGQSTTYTEIEVEGNAMIQYGDLTYQGIQIGETVDASTMEFLHIDVWTATEDYALDVYPISISSGEQLVQLNPVAGEWNSYDIPLSDFTDQGLSMADIHQFKFVGIPDGAGTVFIDNLYFYKEPGGVVTAMVEDFENEAPAFTTFGNIPDAEVVVNPDMSGINTSNNVGALTKAVGSEVWAGTFFEIAEPLDFVTYSNLKAKIWTPNPGIPVKLKLENADTSIVYEVDVNTTTSNEWESLTFNFNDAPAADYVRIVFFFDFGNGGDDSVYYFDDIELASNGGDSTPLGFQDFEGEAPAFTTFGNIPDAQVISNPDMSGVNTTANVVELTKTGAAEVWAGTFFEVDTPLNLSSYSSISVKTWSPNSGIVVKLKLENADTSIVHEVDVVNTVSNQWEELVFNMSAAPPADYVRVVMFFDFGNAGDDSTYYFDEFALTN
ncbi:MAG: hypothetical protein BM564_02780 [Bacteroidetes bacterium MedPE-SWsnd-G2]|nr:MAG: hypothetical protein BM564_02780 [Bacteroidetes bacterium MedPE-SWsnd-G2]